VCLANECRDGTISAPNAEHSHLSQAQEDSASDLNTKEDQSHKNIDQHLPDAITMHRNQTGLHENEQKDMATKGSKCKDLLLSTMNSPN